jgi:transcriptional regulator with XRE-family HTH domain
MASCFVKCSVQRILAQINKISPLEKISLKDIFLFFYLRCMRKAIDTVKLTFGLKVHQLRQDMGLSYQQLSDKTGLAVSYLHNIEKGKKYPKADKIILLADALGTEYNYLVSLDGDKRLKPIIDLINSDFLKIFPLELFGINMPKLLELLSVAPAQVNAFISTVIKVVRNHELQGEDFYKAALRSYQDLNNNYFSDLEAAVATLKKEHQLSIDSAPSLKVLEQLLSSYGISIDREYLKSQQSLSEVRSFYSPKRNILYLNTPLSNAQERFLLAKELGFQYLKLKERPFETRILEVNSFEKLLNNFRASYFSVSLLMDENAIIRDVKQMSKWERWDGEAFLALFQKYNVTSEMLIQRLANILPQHFGLKDLFFFRFFTDPNLQKFKMTKEMHLSQLHDPHANQLEEHYCRRWISINLIRRLRAMESLEGKKEAIIGAQISRYWNTPNAYFCVSIAKPEHDDPQNSTSITIGLLVDDKLRNLFRFLDDPKIAVKDVHTTCERCGISDCGARVVPPIILHQARIKKSVKKELEALGRKK